MTQSPPNRTPERVRHELRFRQLNVQAIHPITPHLLRVVLGGAQLQGFHSAAFDDHCKLVFPDATTGVLITPEVTAEGIVWPEGPRPATRDYTPHSFNAEQQTIAFDFVLHEAGPATAWALNAKVGDAVGVGGPRGSFIIPTNFDWYLLAGDDTALPAIARRLQELPAGSRALAIIEVANEKDVQPLASSADVQLHWVFRDSTEAGAPGTLLTKLESLTLPEGDFYGWVACESAAAKTIRQHLITVAKANPKWLRVSGYWKRGNAATHESFDE